MYCADTVKQKNEIRNGDRRLMKCPLLVWRQIRKSQNLEAINMINPRGRGERNPMGLHNMTPGIPSSIVEDFADLRAKAVVGEVSVETDERGNVTGMQHTGNASLAPKKKGD